MRRRLPFFRSDGDRDRGSVLELLVLEGQDAGRQFTVDGSEVAIGRGRPRSGHTGAILLADPTVSSQQAVIRVSLEGAVIEHRRGATNPTRVNGREIQRQRIAPGDRIQMGLAVLEVRSRKGIALGGLTAALTERRATELYQPAAEPEPGGAVDASRTEVRRADTTPRGSLTVVRGLPGLEGRRFPLGAHKTSVGRDPGSDVPIPEDGVSRNHAELIWDGPQLVLVHCSQTNATFVNGLPVESRETLHGGEEIQLADKVVLRLDLEGPAPTAEPRQPRAPLPESLLARMEEKIRRDQEIEQEFGVSGSFLDIDVVDSHGLKAQASRAEYIIVSFERFREFARGVVEEFDGQLLNSNGDELMCFFDSPHQAVRSASAILKRLAEFNQKENLLGRPFRVRQGIHTGSSLVDRRRGIAYSTVLDVAGHLQKHADTDGLLISEGTLKALPEGLPFERAWGLEKERMPTHRLTGPLD